MTHKQPICMCVGGGGVIIPVFSIRIVIMMQIFFASFGIVSYYKPHLICTCTLIQILNIHKRTHNRLTVIQHFIRSQRRSSTIV